VRSQSNRQASVRWRRWLWLGAALWLLAPSFAPRAWAGTRAAETRVAMGGVGHSLPALDFARLSSGSTRVSPLAQAGMTITPAAGLAHRVATRLATDRRRGNSRALLTALMSAAVPGAGQLRNGSLLRGLGYFAVEVTGWVAYGAFQQSSREKRDEYGDLAADDWDYSRYHTRAPDPDSCAFYDCGCGLWSPDGDAEIVARMEAGDLSRFHEYLTRDAYACGWDSPLSREIYLGLWSDREDALGAQRWTGRLIFLNHLVSAVDAFVEARSLALDRDGQTQVQLRVRGPLFDPRPEVRITRRF
jgi:hypothetical protein